MPQSASNSASQQQNPRKMAGKGEGRFHTTQDNWSTLPHGAGPEFQKLLQPLEGMKKAGGSRKSSKESGAQQRQMNNLIFSHTGQEAEEAVASRQQKTGAAQQYENWLQFQSNGGQQANTTKNKQPSSHQTSSNGIFDMQSLSIGGGGGRKQTQTPLNGSA